MWQVLFRQLPVAELVSALTALLGKKSLHRSSEQWQQVALSSLSLLTSKVCMESAPLAVDDVVATAVPLLYVGTNGNEFADQVIQVIQTSSLAKVHPALKVLGGVATQDGNGGLTLV